MKYLKYLFKMIKKCIKGIWGLILPYLYFFLFVALLIFSEVAEYVDFSEWNINPNDYCNLTDVDYTAVLHDDPNGKACVEITEYLTFDVHASSRNNPYRELWRELPENEVDGLKVTYDVKSVSQILFNGREVPYTNTSKMYWEDEDYTENATQYWHHSKGSGFYPDNDESLLIYIPWTYRDKLKFKIVYTLNNAALKYNDCSELYLSMYSGNSITKLQSYKAKILIPNELMPSEYYAYSFGTKNSRIPFQESATENSGYYTFSMNLDKNDLKFNYHNRYIEFCLLAYGKDKHIFTKYARNNDYSHEDVLEECISENEYYTTQNIIFTRVKTCLFVVSIGISAFLVLHTMQQCKKKKQEYSLFEPSTKYDYFRDIPSDLDPIFASELVFMKDPFNENKEKQEEYAAILLSLVRKKYVVIEKKDNTFDWTKNNTVINLERIKTVELDNTYTTVNEITGVSLEPLTTSERLYYELLERHTRYTNGSITLSTLQNKINSDYEYTNAFVKDIEKKPALESGVMNHYFLQTDYNALKNKFETSAKISFAFALIFFIGVNFISYFTPLALCFGAYTILGIAFLWKYMYLTAKAGDFVLFTQYGVDEQAKWIGLYNFLNSDTLMNEKNVNDLVLWEKYLIYATAFGISEKVVKAIKINAVNINIDNSPILNHHCYIHSSHFHATSRSFGHSLHTTSRGGGFGGHGYGGGGRGGGGGGGGH